MELWEQARVVQGTSAKFAHGMLCLVLERCVADAPFFVVGIWQLVLA